jgi:hypothetical protein
MRRQYYFREGGEEINRRIHTIDRQHVTRIVTCVRVCVCVCVHMCVCVCVCVCVCMCHISLF